MAFICQAVADVAIAGTLCYVLSRQKTGIRRCVQSILSNTSKSQWSVIFQHGFHYQLIGEVHDKHMRIDKVDASRTPREPADQITPSVMEISSILAVGDIEVSVETLLTPEIVRIAGRESRLHCHCGIDTSWYDRVVIEYLL